MSFKFRHRTVVFRPFRLFGVPALYFYHIRLSCVLPHDDCTEELIQSTSDA